MGSHKINSKLLPKEFAIEVEKLTELARPLQDFIQEKYDLMTVIVVGAGDIDVYSNKTHISTPESIKD